MATKTKSLPEKGIDYHAMVNSGHNMYSVVTITVVNDTVVHTAKTEPAILAIAFNLLRTKMARDSLSVIQGNAE